MKIGILGSGDVAKALGSGFLKHGHEVMLGTRAPAKLAEWMIRNPEAHVAKFVDAAKFGDPVVLAVKGTAAAEALRAAGTANLADKPVIDVTNPIADAPPVNGVQFGWEIADMGKVEGARAIEPLCMLWCIPGFLRNEWTHAFKLLTS